MVEEIFRSFKYQSTSTSKLYSSMALECSVYGFIILRLAGLSQLDTQCYFLSLDESFTEGFLVVVAA